MGLSHKLCTLLTALLVLVPLCGCGKIALPLTEPTSHCPCCPVDEDEKNGNSDGDGCESGLHSSKKYTVEKQPQLSSADPDNDDTGFAKGDSLPVAVVVISESTSIAETPDLSIKPPLWRLYCNFRL